MSVPERNAFAGPPGNVPLPGWNAHTEQLLSGAGQPDLRGLVVKPRSTEDERPALFVHNPYDACEAENTLLFGAASGSAGVSVPPVAQSGDPCRTVDSCSARASGGPVRHRCPVPQCVCETSTGEEAPSVALCAHGGSEDNNVLRQRGVQHEHGAHRTPGVVQHPPSHSSFPNPHSRFPHIKGSERYFGSY